MHVEGPFSSMLTSLQNIIAYPIARGKLINVVASTVDPSKIGTRYDGSISGIVGDKEGVVRRFQHWDGELQHLLEVHI